MKRILFVSDYITNIGGIENYIYNTSHFLQDNNFEIKTLGLDNDLIKNKRFRILLMPATAFNIYISIRLIWIYLFWQPDIIYFHSVTRFVGRLPIFLSGYMRADRMMMYHDLGFVSPYPSQVYNTSQLPKKRTFEYFWDTNYSDYLYFQQKTLLSKIKYIYIRGIVGLKFLSISVWRFFAIKSIQKHIVPSPFMHDILKKRGIKKQNIYILGHFGSN